MGKREIIKKGEKAEMKYSTHTFWGGMFLGFVIGINLGWLIWR